MFDGDDGAARIRIGELSRRTGVSPELLRAWQDRYALLSPRRTAGGFRLYDAVDEQRIRLMLGFLESGMAAAEAARLVLAAPPEAGPVAEAGRRAELPREDDLRRALDDFDGPAAHAALDRAFAAYGLEVVIGELVLPYLRQLGERWQDGSASIAQEHFASALLRGRLLALSRAWGNGSGPLALLACVPGDQHDLGLLCFGLALQEHAWRISFLGADAPIETIADAARRLEPDLVVLAASSAEQVAACVVGIAELTSIAHVALGGVGARARAARSLDVLRLEGDPVGAATTVARVVTRSAR